MDVNPILRWAGSKRKLLPAIVNNCPQRFNRYVEPFAGSASVFMKLNPGPSIINDINVELIRTYRVVKRAASAVAGALDEYPKSKDLYYLLRSILPTDLDPISRAARFIYLNRFSFNGVYRTNSAGYYNVPMGTKTGNLPTEEELRRFGERLQHTVLRSRDFEEIVDQARKDDFYYLDPPYSEPETR